MFFKLVFLVVEVVEKIFFEYLDDVFYKIGKMNEVVCKFFYLELDRVEFCFLKVLVFFNFGKL